MMEEVAPQNLPEQRKETKRRFKKLFLKPKQEKQKQKRTARYHGKPTEN